MACFSFPTPPNLHLGQESSLQLQRNLWWELFVKIIFYFDIKIISFQYSSQLTFKELHKDSYMYILYTVFLILLHYGVNA